MYHRKTSNSRRSAYKQSSTQKSSVRPVVSTALMVINDAPIRKKAIQSAKRAMKELEKKNTEIERFEKEDQPAFSKWYNTSFGKLLTDLRECEGKIQSVVSIVHEVQHLANKEGIPYYLAYEKVMYRREHPEECIEFDDDSDNPSSDYFGDDDWSKKERQDKRERDFFSDSNLSDEELEAIFSEMIEEMMGFRLNPRSSEFKKMFNEFKKSYHQHHSGNSSNKEDKKVDSNIELRLKEKYRILVRVLHPDYNKDSDPKKKELWHKVQQAYKEKDLEKLETYIAICEIVTGGNLNQINSVSTIQQITTQYREEARLLGKKLKQFKKDVAWNFSKATSTETKKLYKTLNMELAYEYQSMKDDLTYFNRTVDEWKTQLERSKNKKNNSKTKESKKPKTYSILDELILEF